MLEFISVISIVYFIGLVLTIIVGNTIGKSWNEPLGFCIVAGVAVLWPVLVPALIYEEYKDWKTK
jgi:hypothetical protein